jgi:phage shock protein PspC (stress-responsive transcriptional regulator)
MRRLYRSRRYSIIGGVLGGIGEYFDVDPTIVRLIAVGLLFLLGPFIPLAYILMWIFVPYDQATVPTDRFERVERIKDEVVTSVKEGFDRVAGRMREKFGERPEEPHSTSTAPSQPQQAGIAPDPGPGRAAGASHPESGAVIFGELLIAVGVLLLLSNAVPEFTLKWWGPALLIAAGLYFIVWRHNR